MHKVTSDNSVICGFKEKRYLHCATMHMSVSCNFSASKADVKMRQIACTFIAKYTKL